VFTVIGPFLHLSAPEESLDHHHGGLGKRARCPQGVVGQQKTSQLSTPIPNPTGYGDHRFISKMETPIHPEVQYFDIAVSAVDRSRRETHIMNEMLYQRPEED